MRQSWVSIAMFAVLIGLAVFMILGRKAPTPDVFSAGTTLEAAIAQSEATGKPVLALATADWCAPCQSLKRGALTNSEVVAFIESETIPVYLDHAKNRDEIGRLGVMRYPTTVLISANGSRLIQGGGRPEDYLRAIREAAGG